MSNDRDPNKIILHHSFFLLLVPLFLMQAIYANLCVASSATIVVTEKAQVTQENVILGDISDITSEDPELAGKLKTVVIGNAPLPGKSRFLDLDYLKIRLKQKGFDLSSLDIKAPEEIEVSRDSILIPVEETRKIILAFLQKRFVGDKCKFQIRDIRVDSDVILPKGDITYDVVPPKNTDFLGTVPISVFFKVDGNVQSRIWATVDIGALSEVVITKKPLRRYQLISEDDIKLERRDLANLPSNIIRNPDEVLGKRAKRAIDSNQFLRTDLVELPPLVKTGDIVLITAEADGLRVTAIGKVKGRARRGERVKVLNLDSSRSVYARVLDSKTVKVDF